MRVPVLSALYSLILTACATTPVAKTGSTTALNSNPGAIAEAAQTVFASHGYTLGPVELPGAISFDKPAGAFGKLMYGSYGRTTSVRCTMTITPIPGTADYRLAARPLIVNDAGQAGFEEARPLLIGASEFTPLLREVAAVASQAGSE